LIVRWGLDQLRPLLAELGVERPFLVASTRWDHLDVPHASRWSEIPSERIEVPADADAILVVGGGSANDTAKAASNQSGLPVIAVPTTYSGAEWNQTYGVRTPEKRMVGGGRGANLVAIVYEPELTVGLDRQTTVGTSLNALAHTAEALYAKGHNPEGDEHALQGARLIAEWLPQVVDRPDDLHARAHLLEGAMHAGAALGSAGLALGHAMAQAVGGAYGLPHGTLNAISLPAALRFNEPLAPDAVRRFGEAIGAPDDPAGGVEALARLGGVTRLRDLGVPEGDLAELAAKAAVRAGNKANPRPATPEEIERLLGSVW
jgi:maleylacetate reductase